MLDHHKVEVTVLMFQFSGQLLVSSGRHHHIDVGDLVIHPIYLALQGVYSMIFVLVSLEFELNNLFT